MQGMGDTCHTMELASSPKAGSPRHSHSQSSQPAATTIFRSIKSCLMEVVKEMGRRWALLDKDSKEKY
jgi:hypothetical protein